MFTFDTHIIKIIFKILAFTIDKHYLEIQLNSRIF